MVCDIHGMVEINEYDQWEGVIYLRYLLRNYNYFCSLADVRCYDEETGIIPKGLPEDISAGVRRLYSDLGEGDDAHSDSWLYGGEFVDKIFLSKPEIMDNSWNSLIMMITILQSVYGNENVRVVFWFDN